MTASRHHLPKDWAARIANDTILRYKRAWSVKLLRKSPIFPRHLISGDHLDVESVYLVGCILKAVTADSNVSDRLCRGRHDRLEAERRRIPTQRASEM